ncbi:hypothetical protein KAS08_01860 [Candidatus Pacearchaeota archaeon]|nr:hypothetical protein [Candidatus Pacearchaeota archaeon]
MVVLLRFVDEGFGLMVNQRRGMQLGSGIGKIQCRKANWLADSGDLWDSRQGTDRLKIWKNIINAKWLTDLHGRYRVHGFKALA